MRQMPRPQGHRTTAETEAFLEDDEADFLGVVLLGHSLAQGPCLPQLNHSSFGFLCGDMGVGLTILQSIFAGM